MEHVYNIYFNDDDTMSTLNMTNIATKLRNLVSLLKNSTEGDLTIEEGQLKRIDDKLTEIKRLADENKDKITDLQNKDGIHDGLINNASTELQKIGELLLEVGTLKNKVGLLENSNDLDTKLQELRNLITEKDNEVKTTLTEEFNTKLQELKDELTSTLNTNLNAKIKENSDALKQLLETRIGALERNDNTTDGVTIEEVRQEINTYVLQLTNTIEEKERVLNSTINLKPTKEYVDQRDNEILQRLTTLSDTLTNDFATKVGLETTKSYLEGLIQVVRDGLNDKLDVRVFGTRILEIKDEIIRELTSTLDNNLTTIRDNITEIEGKISELEIDNVTNKENIRNNTTTIQEGLTTLRETITNLTNELGNYKNANDLRLGLLEDKDRNLTNLIGKVDENLRPLINKNKTDIQGLEDKYNQLITELTELNEYLTRINA